MQGNETLLELAEQAHRLKCLELALEFDQSSLRNIEQVVKDAEVFVTFITGRNASSQGVTTE